MGHLAQSERMRLYVRVLQAYSRHFAPQRILLKMCHRPLLPLAEDALEFRHFCWRLRQPTSRNCTISVLNSVHQLQVVRSHQRIRDFNYRGIMRH